MIAHSDGTYENVEDEAVVYTDEPIYLSHADDPEEDKEEPEKEPERKEEKKVADEKKEKTVQDVFDELTEEQKQVVYFMIGQALEDKGGDDK